MAGVLYAHVRSRNTPVKTRRDAVTSCIAWTASEQASQLTAQLQVTQDARTMCALSFRCPVHRFCAAASHASKHPQTMTVSMAHVDNARASIAKLVNEKSCGPLFVRLAWFDAGTFTGVRFAHVMYFKLSRLRMMQTCALHMLALPAACVLPRSVILRACNGMTVCCGARACVPTRMLVVTLCTLHDQNWRWSGSALLIAVATRLNVSFLRSRSVSPSLNFLHPCHSWF